MDKFKQAGSFQKGGKSAGGYAGSAWQNVAGAADGSAWVIGTGTVQGGHDIDWWNGKGWQFVQGGGATQISVGLDGVPWVVSASGSIHQRVG